MTKVRDQLNTVSGYDEIIDFNKESIEEELNDLKSYNRDETRKIRLTNFSIYNYQIGNFKARYSVDAEFDELSNLLEKTLKVLPGFWKAESGYAQMMDMLSLGIMFEIEDSEFDKLVGLVERDNVNDYLIDFLIRYRRPDWQQTDKFLWNKPYKGISEIVKLSTEDKSAALERLKKYLNEWYKSLETKTHESKWNIHTGYWCWEAGALVKILGLDDSGLKDQQYYPYDMVHWKD